MIPTVRLASLFSNWYSGATLFTILLDNHSEIVSNGEALPFDSGDDTRYVCSCGKSLEECEFYHGAAGHMRTPDTGRWNPEVFVQVPSFSRNRLMRFVLGSPRVENILRSYLIERIPRYRRTRNLFLDAQLQFFTKATRLAKASLYLDGTKSIRRAQLFARDGRCDQKAIHVVRDGRGFCHSYLKNRHLTENDTFKAAREWLYYIWQVDKFSKDFPRIPILTVRYEDLCRSTATVMEAVTRFLDIPYEEPTAIDMKEKHILGNRMRRTFKGEIVEDKSWTEQLSPKMQAEITRMTRRELERFGYL